MSLFDLVAKSALASVYDAGQSVAALAVDLKGALWVRISGAATDVLGLAYVTDNGVSLVSAGNVNCTSAAPLSAETSPAYIIVTNLDASATVYLGGSGVTGSTNGEALPAGQSRAWRSANPSLEYAIGSSTVNVSIRR